jgi:hypothetical protein
VCIDIAFFFYMFCFFLLLKCSSNYIPHIMGFLHGIILFFNALIELILFLECPSKGVSSGACI